MGSLVAYRAVKGITTTSTIKTAPVWTGFPNPLGCGGNVALAVALAALTGLAVLAVAVLAVLAAAALAVAVTHFSA